MLRRRGDGLVVVDDDDDAAGAGDLETWFAVLRCRRPVDVDAGVDPDPEAEGLAFLSLWWPELEAWAGRE